MYLHVDLLLYVNSVACLDDVVSEYEAVIVLKCVFDFQLHILCILLDVVSMETLLFWNFTSSCVGKKNVDKKTTGALPTIR